MKYITITKICILWCGILSSLNCDGQIRWQPDRLPLGVMPMEFNPSFAGQAGAARISSGNFYSKSSKIYGYENSYGTIISFDHFIPVVASGIGITAGYFGGNGVNHERESAYTSLSIAPKISIKGKYTLSPSFDFSYSSFNQSFSFFTHPSDIRSGPKAESISSRAGLLFNTNKYYIGYSVYLYSRYTALRDGVRESGINSVFGSNLQLGYTFQRSSESKFSFTPQISFFINKKTHPENKVIRLAGYNLNFNYRKYLAGVSNAGLHLGWQDKRFRIVAGSNLGVPPVPDSSFRIFSGNLSFRYIFAKADKGMDQSRF